MKKPRRKDFRSDDCAYDFEGYAEKMDEYDVFVLEQEKEASRLDDNRDKKVYEGISTHKKDEK